jgi:hypothetical protein
MAPRMGAPLGWTIIPAIVPGDFCSVRFGGLAC